LCQSHAALLRPRADFYSRRLPQPGDVLLIVEVADTSLEYDRTMKVPLYARAGTPEVWLADLNGDGLDVYREPSADGYRVFFRVERGQHVAPLAFPDLHVRVEDLLGE
jgi:Uma2 family endonuclease